MARIDMRVPVTVLTGFLGSGKTTLLNRILKEEHGKKIAVIENEFGEVGIDHELVIGADEEIFEMNNGCLCCTVRGDLIRILQNLMKRKDRFDYILIETTGLADPGPVIQTFYMDEELKANLRMDGIITLVDSFHFLQQIDRSAEAGEQIGFADVVILNKVDLVSPQDIDHLKERIGAMNSHTKILVGEQAGVEIDQILNIQGFHLDRALEVDPQFLEEESPFEWAGCFNLKAGDMKLQLREGPDPAMDFLALPGGPDDEGQILAEARKLFGGLSTAVDAGGTLGTSSLQRMNLWQAPFEFSLRVPTSGPWWFFTQHHPEEFEMTWGEAIPLVERQFKGAHSHDDEVSSVGITLPGELDLEKINLWLGTFLQVNGPDVFRFKGVFAFKGHQRRFVFQGVHMLFEGAPDRPWDAAEARESRMVFIGRNLNRDDLEKGIRSCLAS